METKRINLLSKNNRWTHWITKRTGDTLVKEGVAVKKGFSIPLYVMKYTEKEIEEWIQIRDHKQCRFCGKGTKKIDWLIPKQLQGEKTLVNGVCICETCIEIKNEWNTATLYQKIKPMREENFIFLHHINESAISGMNSRCVFCKRDMEVNHEKQMICNICKNEGFISLYDEKGERMQEISIVKKRKLLEKSMIFSWKEKDALQFKHKKERIWYQFADKWSGWMERKKTYIIISRSGKWSTEGTKKEANALIQQNLAKMIQPTMVRMTINIEDFKEMIIKRDKRKCYFCGKKAHGVFSKSDIKTFTNSVCACIDCEYERDEKKLLNWLNITEEKGKWFQKHSTDLIWLSEKNGNKRFKIKKVLAEMLVKEEMAERMNEKKIKLLYNAQEFREFILEREQKKCHYCGQKGKTVDHVIPRSKGGLTTPKNCVCACEKCNTRKGNTDKRIFVDYIQKNKNET